MLAQVLTLRRPEQFASLDQGIYGHLTRRNLAALAAERGDREEAERLWRAVLEECPGDREATAKLDLLRGAPGRPPRRGRGARGLLDRARLTADHCSGWRFGGFGT